MAPKKVVYSSERCCLVIFHEPASTSLANLNAPLPCRTFIALMTFIRASLFLGCSSNRSPVKPSDLTRWVSTMPAFAYVMARHCFQIMRHRLARFGYQDQSPIRLIGLRKTHHSAPSFAIYASCGRISEIHL